MSSAREWMYKIDTSEFYEGIEDFVKQADSFFRSLGYTDGTIKCPCKRCKHLEWKGCEDVKYDLYRFGFVHDYYVWTSHGEQHELVQKLPVRVSHYFFMYGPDEKPKFINLATWQALCRKWRSEEFAIKSKRGQDARKANKRLHTGGSISMVDHLIRMQKELGREPTAPERFSRTHKHKNGNFVDREAEATWVGYNEKYGSDDSVGANSGDASKSFSRWVEHVGIKNGRVYGEGSGVDQFSLRGNNNDEPSVSSSNKSAHLESMLELQQAQLVLLKKEQDHLRSTQEEHTTKLDEVLDYQSSFEDNFRNTMSEEVRQLVSQEIGKVALEVRKVVAQEVGKSVAQEIGKAQRQILEAIQCRQ